MHPLTRVVLITAAALAAGTVTLYAQPAARVASPDGRSTASIGLLAQPQIDWESASGAETSGSFCFRRLRVIGAGTVLGKLKFFVDSDAPHLGFHTEDRKMKREVFLQDLILTYEAHPSFMVDGGLMMVPISYNTLQSAASLLTPAYGPYSFLASSPTTSRVGRDYGVQARGYVLGKHLEYRVGAFQGYRQLDPDAPLRYAGRVAWHVLEPQTGFTYTGTSLGRKELLSFGASVDHQHTYTTWSVDAFYDRPIHGDNALTLQADYIKYNGDTTFEKLPEQHTMLVEAGYFVRRWKSSVFTQVARKNLTSGRPGDATNWQVGVGYWAMGHRLNVKGGVGRVTSPGRPTRTQVTLLTQVFLF